MSIIGGHPIENHFVLQHIEWVELDNSKSKYLKLLIIVSGIKYSIKIFEYQYTIFNELYNFLLPYTKRIVIDKNNQQLLIYNKLREQYKEIRENLSQSPQIHNTTPPITTINLDKIKQCKIIYNPLNQELDVKDIALMNLATGGIGVLAAVWASEHAKKFIKDLKIELIIDEIDSPIYIYYKTGPLKINSEFAESLLKMCEEDYKILHEICKYNNSQNIISDAYIPYDELKQLKELLDMGILSQEEFDKKKKELLNL